MKSVNLSAFRKRLYRAGFTKIEIYGLSNGLYLVSCFDRNNNYFSDFFDEMQMRDGPLFE